VEEGKQSLPKVLGVNHWTIIAIIWVIMILMLTVVEKKKL
jgi:hypothetical protein